MIKLIKSGTPTRRAGFSLIEATIVSIFMSFLAVLLSLTWSAFLRPTSDIAIRCRIAQEANLVVASLTRDLAGSYADDRTDKKDKFKLVGRMQPDGSGLRLCYDGGDTPNGTADWNDPDLVVSYYTDTNQLIRWDEASGSTFVVARDFDSLEAVDQGDGSVQLKLNFRYRNVNQTYTLIARDP